MTHVRMRCVLDEDGGYFGLIAVYQPLPLPFEGG